MVTGKRLAAAALLPLLFGSSDGARAHWSASQGGSLYVDRYLACGDHPFDQPRCVGLRAQDWIIKSLSLPALSPGKNNDDVVDPAHLAAVTAVYYNVREAIPRLRKILALRTKPADRDQHVSLEKNGLRAQAAYALANLGDRESVGKIRELVREFEVDGHGFLWRDTLEALATIDGKAAAEYATEFLGRARNWRMSLPGGGSKTDALSYLTRANYRPALKLLRRLTADEGKPAGLDDHTFCMMMGARVALGDEPLRTQVRALLLGNYSGTWLAGCEEHLYTGLGNHPDDAAALLRRLGQLRRPGVPHSGMDYGVTNRSYISVLRLVWRLRQNPAHGAVDARVERAEENLREGLSELERKWPETTSAAKKREAERLLRDGLRERASWPHVSKPGHEDYAPHFAAMHMAALAGLGDNSAREKLYLMIDGDKDRSGAAWIAAYWAVRLRLEGVQEHVASLMQRGVTYDNQEHTGLYQGIRTRVLNAYAWEYPDDARWAVLLLDHGTEAMRSRGDAAERALYLLSRWRPAGACAVVTKAAPRATAPAVEWAFLSLTALGQNCRVELEEVAKNSKLAAKVRGPAIEMLAAMRADATDELIRRSAGEEAMRIYLERARIIYAASRQR
jgi:hypothetical protein